MSGSTTTARAFNQLRVDHFTSSKAGALPPTSSEIRGHIHRRAFLVNRAYRLPAIDNEREARLDQWNFDGRTHTGAIKMSETIDAECGRNMEVFRQV